MAKGWILRGQGVGPMHWLVFANYPTDADFRKALDFELERHGVKIEAGEPDADGEPTVTMTPRERWIRAAEVEIQGLPDRVETAEDIAGRRKELRGLLGPDDVRRIGDQIIAAPPGSAVASMEVLATGTGSVTNPGDPGFVKSPTKYPGDARDRPAADEMTIASSDVGSISSALGPDDRK